MARKNNYDGYNVTIPVKSMADAVTLMRSMSDAGVIVPEGEMIGLRERDVLDERKNRLDLIVDNGTDPAMARIWTSRDGIVDTFRFDKDDLAELASEVPR